MPSQRTTSNLNEFLTFAIACTKQLNYLNENVLFIRVRGELLKFNDGERKKIHLVVVWFSRLGFISAIDSRQLDMLSWAVIDKTHLEVLTWKSSLCLWWLKA